MRAKEQQRLQSTLLQWYDVHGRDLPWRVKGGQGEPYRVWLSEVMLQQTTVVTVKPYFEAFTDRWPTVQDLAAAGLDDVLQAWAGLGYYARARNLHKCAVVVAHEQGGVFPDTEDELLKLPGIGAYTAAAIAAIAFGRRSAPVDGNIIRVISRLFKLETPLPKLRTEIPRYFAPLVPEQRPGDFVQAIMDVGAGICTPRNPNCKACPWLTICDARKAGFEAGLPIKAPKKVKPTRYGTIFWLENGDGEILLRRRPEKGLLGGMMEFPSTDWREHIWPPADALQEAPLKADWQMQPGAIRHTFTHFHLELAVMRAKIPTVKGSNGVWSHPDRFPDHALPTLMKKVVQHVRSAA